VRHTLLTAVSDAERRRVVAHARRRRFAPDEVVFHEGDPGDAMHVVLRGHALVRTSTPRGDRLALALLGPGDQFGELSVLREDHRHTATVVALDDLETLAIGRSTVELLCRADPATALALARLLAASTERLGHRLIEASFLPAAPRIARRLAEAADTFQGGSVPITQDVLAELAGVSRSTVNEVLRDLERRSVVRLDRHAIQILDERTLRGAARW